MAAGKRGHVSDLDLDALQPSQHVFDDESAVISTGTLRRLIAEARRALELDQELSRMTIARNSLALSSDVHWGQLQKAARERDELAAAAREVSAYLSTARRHECMGADCSTCYPNSLIALLDAALAKLDGKEGT